MSKDLALYISDFYSFLVKPQKIRLFNASGFYYFYETCQVPASNASPTCYLAPEKFYSYEKCHFCKRFSGDGTKSDMFSLGCILYELQYRKPFLSLQRLKTIFTQGCLLDSSTEKSNTLLNLDPSLRVFPEYSELSLLM
jgi:serine/threonine protein kinase